MKQIKYVTPTTPWASLSVEDGDCIYFEGGHTYPAFRIAGAENVQIGSYGLQPAIIDGATGNGVEIHGCRLVLLSGLIVKGDGWRVNQNGIGVLVENCEEVTVCNVEALGFQQSGIEIVSSRHIRVEGCYAHNNGFCGINTRITDNQNEDVTIRYCKALDNGGSPSYKENHSGSGIGIFHTRHAVVEFCEAAGNGWAQRQKNGNGPVGIWCACDVDDVVFRYCISRHNRTQPGGVDGDGFDIDGGVVNGMMAYNYSYENEGSGYLFCEYGSGLDYRDNHMAACISLGDATRVPYQGAAQYYGPDWMELANSVSKDCLLMPAPGKACVVNGDLGDLCRNMSLTDTVMIPSARGVLSNPDNHILHLEHNAVLEDEALYTQLSDCIPRLTDPRVLPALPVFARLEAHTLADALENGDWGDLFGAPAADTAPCGDKAFTYELGGRDFAGSDCRGEAQLVFDSLKPGFALELRPHSDIRFEYTDWDSSQSHTAVLTARLTTPDTEAFFYIAEDGKPVKAIPLSGTVSEYQTLALDFSGFEGVPTLGIMTGAGTGSAMLDTVEIYHRPATCGCAAAPDPAAPLTAYTHFGDVYASEEGIHLRGAGARLLKRCWLDRPTPVTLRAVVSGTGTLSIACGDRCTDLPFSAENESVSLTLDSAAGPLTCGVSNGADAADTTLLIRSFSVES